jgi:hypothetical protein
MNLPIPLIEYIPAYTFGILTGLIIAIIIKFVSRHKK